MWEHRHAPNQSLCVISNSTYEEFALRSTQGTDKNDFFFKILNEKLCEQAGCNSVITLCRITPFQMVLMEIKQDLGY